MVDYEGPCRLAIAGPEGETVALCNMQNEDGDVDEANAALIASAPDLLKQRDALREALQLIYPMALGYARINPIGNNKAFCEQARASLALCNEKDA